MRRIRVVLADDHALVREGVRRLLELESDLEVVGEASSGDEVVQLASDLRPDVVLLDLSMPGPGEGGIDALRRIKESTPDVQVVVLTIHDDEQYLLAALRAGAIGYVLKDIEPRLLVEAVRAASVGSSYLQRAVAGKVLARLNETRPPALAPSLPPGLELTRREIEILSQIGLGKNNREIAQFLFISEKTARNHVSRVLAKIRAGDRTQAALFAIRHGLVDPSQSGQRRAPS